MTFTAKVCPLNYVSVELIEFQYAEHLPLKSDSQDEICIQAL